MKENIKNFKFQFIVSLIALAALLTVSIVCIIDFTKISTNELFADVALKNTLIYSIPVFLSTLASLGFVIFCNMQKKRYSEFVKPGWITFLLLLCAAIATGYENRGCLTSGEFRYILRFVLITLCMLSLTAAVFLLNTNAFKKAKIVSVVAFVLTIYRVYTFGMIVYRLEELGIAALSLVIFLSAPLYEELKTQVIDDNSYESDFLHKIGNSDGENRGE